jgi:hypothetical protein
MKTAILFTDHKRTCLKRAKPRPVVHERKDGSCCDHYGVKDPSFICPECHRRVGYCMGCDDDYPDLCDDCRAKKGFSNE